MARIGALQAALDNLDGVAGADRERARLHSAMAAAYLLDDRLDEAITHGELSRAESQRTGDEEAALNAAATLGTVLVFAGRMDEGWQLLEDAITRARGTQQEAEAARGYRMIGSSASELMEYDRAERWLTEGIRYAEQVELWNHRHYMASHLAHIQWATGQWDAATQTAQHALTDGRGGITTQITAQYVLGFLAMGRGDWTAADTLLREALAKSEQMAELQRLSPPLWGLAEAARCRGHYDTALTLCERGYQASAGVTDAAYLFPYLLTGVRAYLALGGIDAAEKLAEPGRRGAHRPRHPRHPARDRPRPGTRPARTRRGIRSTPGAGIGERVVAGPAAVLGRRRGRGLTSQRPPLRRGAAARRPCSWTKPAPSQPRPVPPLSSMPPTGSPRRSTVARQAEPWHPLSAREFEVAQLVAAGLTNRQIADQLVLSPKTISAHITHILTKLGAARRAEIAAWCATVRQTAPP